MRGERPLAVSKPKRGRARRDLTGQQSCVSPVLPRPRGRDSLNRQLYFFRTQARDQREQLLLGGRAVELLPRRLGRCYERAIGDEGKLRVHRLALDIGRHALHILADLAAIEHVTRVDLGGGAHYRQSLSPLLDHRAGASTTVGLLHEFVCL